MKTTNIALLGFNKLTEKYARNLLTVDGFRIVGIHGSHYPTDFAFRDVMRVDDPESLTTAQNVDILVDTLDNTKISYDVIRSALEAGIHIITTNAALMALHGEKLMRLAADKGVSIHCNAALMGGLPILSTLSEQMKGTRITRVYGVVNHIANYALMRMKSRGETLDEAMQAAVEFHYASPNPISEMAGKDTFYKTALLRAACFGVWTNLKEMRFTGLSGIKPEDVSLATDLGFQIKHIGVASRESVDVRPFMVAEGMLFTALSGNLTSIIAESENAGPLFFSGFGGDIDATATTLLNDTIAISEKKLVKPWLNSHGESAACTWGKKTNYYMRILADEREKLASINGLEILSEAECTEQAESSKQAQADVISANANSVLTQDTVAQLAQQLELQQKASNVISLHGGLSGLGRVNHVARQDKSQTIQNKITVNAADISTSRTPFAGDEAKIYAGIIVETTLSAGELMSHFDSETSALIEVFSA